MVWRTCRASSRFPLAVRYFGVSGRKQARMAEMRMGMQTTRTTVFQPMELRRRKAQVAVKRAPPPQNTYISVMLRLLEESGGECKH